MSATESRGDFIKFRDTLDRLECLVEVGKKLIFVSNTHLDNDNAIDHTLQLLELVDVNTSESNAIEELERLVKIQIITLGLGNAEPRRSLLFKMMNTKIDFLKTVSFSALVSEGDMEPRAALKRLAEIRSKVSLVRMDDLVNSKIREVGWGSRANPLAGYTTVAFANVTADPAPKQENAERDVLDQCEDCKTTAKLASSALTSLQGLDEVDAKDGDGSTKDGGELIPTSTVMPGQPDLMDG